jgi:hypothetical protein
MDQATAGLVEQAGEQPADRQPDGGEKAAYDSSKNKCAMLYAFRPPKVFNCLLNYDLYVNDQPVCEVANNSTYVMKIVKEGPAKIWAKLNGIESAVNIDAKYGEKYYLRCEITWGMRSHPILTLVKEPEAKLYFTNKK